MHASSNGKRRRPCHEIHGRRLIFAISGIVASIMTREICPLTLDDLSELGRFLTAGFHTAPDADFAAPEVLRWKYLEPRGEDDEAPRSYVRATRQAVLSATWGFAAPRSRAMRSLADASRPYT